MTVQADRALDPLPHAVHFVFKELERWPELVDAPLPPPPEEVAHKFMGARNSWGVQTYVQLRRRGLDVSLVDHYVPDAICVTTYEHLRISDRPWGSYVVACRHDRGRPEIAEQRIVQNRANVVDGTDHFLPHWPQPGILPRHPARGTGVRTVVYQGRDGNLDPAFRSPAFRRGLADLGMRLRSGAVDPGNEVAQWRDYRHADVVLAVRNLHPDLLALKPPSKLFNAWLAGTPALLGPEPAYRDLRRSELDYVEVSGPDEALAALADLRADPERYVAMVANGRERAAEFTPDRIARQWRDLLAGPIAAGYDEWRSAPRWRRTAGRPARFAVRAVRHRRARRRYQRLLRGS